MKVVHITPSIGGGAGIAAYRIHRSLMQHEDVQSSILQRFELTNKNKIENIHQFDSSSLFSKINRRLELSKIGYYKKIISKQSKDFEIVSLPFSYFALHKDKIVQDADIIHLHWVTNFIDYPSFFKNTKQPIVWTLHDMNPFMGIFHYHGDMERNTNPILKDIDNKLHQVKLNCISKRENIHIVTPSKWMSDHSMKSDIFKGLPHSVIGNCFDTEEYTNLDNRIACKEALNIDKSKATLLFVADNINIYRKGMDLLLESLKALPSDSFNLISVGSGDIGNLLPANVNYRSFGSINNSTFLNLIYSAADMTIVPSREDNLPNVVFESMLNGTPVISFKDGGGMAEHIIDGQNGILADKMTSEALANTINEFINGKYRFDYRVVKQYPLDNFNYKKQANLYFNLYKSILNQ